MKIFVCKRHRTCLVYKDEFPAHRECSLRKVYLPDRSGRGVWLPANRNEGGCWKMLICERCSYCLISERVETCPRCHTENMTISHRKNNGVIDGFVDADGPLTTLALNLFWNKDCCFACRQKFPNWRELLGHVRTSHLASVEARGKWVISKNQSHRTKCTGLFICCHCLLSGRLSKWFDKFAYKDYGQLCIRCNSDLYMKPVMMWQGTSNISRPVYDVSEHDQSRCEACYLGVCIYV